MLRGRQLAKLVALVPVGSTRVVTQSSGENYRSSKQTEPSVLTSAIVSASHAASTASAFSSETIGIYAARCAAACSSFCVRAEKPSTSSDDSVEQAAERPAAIQYLPGALTTTSTDTLLTAIDELMADTMRGTTAENSPSKMAVNRKHRVSIRKLDQCTNQVFQLGDVAIFKPQLSVLTQPAQHLVQSRPDPPALTQDANHAKGEDCLHHTHGNLIESGSPRRHPQREGLLANEEPSREMAAYAIDCQNPVLRCGVPPTTTVGICFKKSVFKKVQSRFAQLHGTESSDAQSLMSIGRFSSTSSATECSAILQGTVQAFQPNQGAAEDYGDSTFDPTDVQRVALLDIRLFNTDRHGGNLLVSPQRKLVPIDHGLCLPDIRAVARGSVGAEFVWAWWRHARTAMAPELLTAVQNIDINADAHVLRQLGVRESCVATGMAATALLKWSLKPRILGKDGKLQESQPWTLHDIAVFMQAPLPDWSTTTPSETDTKRSGFAELIGKTMEELVRLHPGQADVYLPCAVHRGDSELIEAADVDQEPTPVMTSLFLQEFQRQLLAGTAATILAQSQSQ